MAAMASPLSGSSELARNLQALGLPYESASRPASPERALSWGSTEAPPEEDGRPTEPAPLSLNAALNEPDDAVRVICYANARAFLEAARSAGVSKNWRLTALLGPAAQTVREEHEQRHAAAPADKRQGELHLWLGVMDGERLSIVLSKIGSRPVVLASPLDAEEIPQAALLRQLSLLAARLRELLPEAVATPGGTIDDDPTTPVTNVPSVLGPAVLARPFASLWLGVSPAAGGAESPARGSRRPPPLVPGLERPLRAFGYSLAQLPRRAQVTVISLNDLITVRLATASDDLPALAGMYEDYSRTTSTPVDRHTARRIVKGAVAGEQCLIYFIESATSPSISLIAGFLLTGCETMSSIAITALWTVEIYRNRGVAEALLRSACHAAFERPRPGKTSVVALIPDPSAARRASNKALAVPVSSSASGSSSNNGGPHATYADTAPTAVRLFSRIGFRVLDKEEYTLVDTYSGVERDEEQDHVDPTPFLVHAPPVRGRQDTAGSSGSVSSVDSAFNEPPTPPPGLSMRRSSERWSELAFEAVSKGCAWFPT